MSEVGFSVVQPSGTLVRNSPATFDCGRVVEDCAAVLFVPAGPEFFEQPKQMSATAHVKMTIFIMAWI
jgi:hypothetical protein